MKKLFIRIQIIVGIALGILLIYKGVLSSTSPLSSKSPLAPFMDPTSFYIVIGGSFGALLASYSISTIFTAIGKVLVALLGKQADFNEQILKMLYYSKIACEDEGIEKLPEEKVLKKKSDDGLLIEGIGLLKKYTELPIMKEQLNSSIEITKNYMSDEINIVKSMGKFAPAFGMIGTLVGLVLMLDAMAMPSKDTFLEAVNTYTGGQNIVKIIYEDIKSGKKVKLNKFRNEITKIEKDKKKNKVKKMLTFYKDVNKIKQVIFEYLKYVEERKVKGLVIGSDALAALRIVAGEGKNYAGKVYDQKRGWEAQKATTVVVAKKMAVALITTLYGAFFANVFFLPLSTTLKNKRDSEITLRKITAEAILLMHDDNKEKSVRNIFENLMKYLPPMQRTDYKFFKDQLKKYKAEK